MKADQLTIGQKVIFSKKPIDSYLKTDAVYLVEDKTIECVYFRNPETKGATADELWRIEFAEFKLVA